MNNENQSASSQWWDYRPFSQDACDLMFARAWLVARENFYLKHGLDARFDEAGNQYRLPLKWNGLAGLKADDATWGGLQKLRLTADKYGIPYSLFWSMAYRVLKETGGWKDEISSCQSALVKSSILELFDEIRKSRVITSDKEFFAADSYSNHPLQDEYINWLIDEVRRKYPANHQLKIGILIGQNKIPAQFAEVRHDA